MNGLGRAGLWLLRGLGRLRHSEPPRPPVPPKRTGAEIIAASLRTVLIYSSKTVADVRDLAVTSVTVLKKRSGVRIVGCGVRNVSVNNGPRAATVVGCGTTKVKVVK